MTNAFKQALVGTYSSSDTVIELASISSTITNADYLPDPSGGEYNLVIYDGLFGNPADARNAGSYEIVRVTGIDYGANEITVTRAQENTSAITIGAGSFQAIFSATVKTFEDIQSDIEDRVEISDIIDNLTSTDTDKPLSANQGKQLQDTKQATLVSGTNIKSINGESVLGSGDLEVGLIPIDYLIIGGGAGGNWGGGGAGGYRTSYNNEESGQLTNAEPPFLIKIGNSYRVQVGEGGGSAQNGSPSFLGNIVSAGGGTAGQYGGSGGGGQNASTVIAGRGSDAQGFDGGQGTGNGTIYTNGGGGGGAGEKGGDGNDSTRIGGNGGDGIESNITGTPTYRAGGGAGAANNITGSPAQATGGLGGGGNGQDSTPRSSTAGEANTGSGGGGNFGGGSSGGSGVVILRYPSKYELTVGAGLTSNTNTVGDDKVTTFTAGADLIQFNLA